MQSLTDFYAALLMSMVSQEHDHMMVGNWFLDTMGLGAILAIGPIFFATFVPYYLTLPISWPFWGTWYFIAGRNTSATFMDFLLKSPVWFYSGWGPQKAE